MVNGKKTEFIEMLEDVAVNPEQGCKVLRVFILLRIDFFVVCSALAWYVMLTQHRVTCR